MTKIKCLGSDSRNLNQHRLLSLVELNLLLASCYSTHAGDCETLTVFKHRQSFQYRVLV